MDGPRHWLPYALLLRARYSAALIGAYVIGIAEICTCVVFLGHSRHDPVPSLLTPANLVIFGVTLVAALIVSNMATSRLMWPAFVWYARGEAPSAQQQSDALSIAARQTAVHVGLWAICSVVFIALNLGAATRNVVLSIVAAAFGGAVLACVGYLVTSWALRPVIAAALTESVPDRWLPGVTARLILTWGLATAIPITAIIAIELDQNYLELLIPPDAPTQVPVLMLAITALVIGLLTILLVARSISDPVQSVGRAMREVEHGNTDVSVPVHDSSEVGRLQIGFNRMVTQVAERERLHELFVRHVGDDVVTRALSSDSDTLGGDVRTVAVLFIDLAGSTTFAATHPPMEVASVLNDFFGIVVRAVSARDGLINKFSGDAALAIFGAPQPLPDPAGAALATARAIRSGMKALPTVDFGIGVSYGQVFAGNIGAAERYEYTVIGDPVNEAARLTELAKSRQGRILAADQAVRAAGEREAKHWSRRGWKMLRGRTERTALSEPNKYRTQPILLPDMQPEAVQGQPAPVPAQNPGAPWAPDPAEPAHE